MQLNTSQSGFVWLPIVLGVFLLAMIGTGGTTYYLQIQKQQDQNQQLIEQVASLQQQTQDLQANIAQQEESSPTPSPKPISSPVPQVRSQIKAATNAQLVPKPTQSPQLSKKEQCEAEAIKTKVEFTQNHVKSLENEITDMKEKSRQHLAVYQKELTECHAEVPSPSECAGKLQQRAMNQAIINAAIKTKQAELDSMIKPGGEMEQAYDSALAACLNL